MIQKYGAALVSIALAAVVFLQTAFADRLDIAEVAQLVAIVAGAVITFLVPLLSGAWAGGLKTGAALLAAAATALAPFLITGTISPEQWMVVALAVLNVLGVELGVQARKSMIDAGTVRDGEPAVITSLPAQAIDPEGVRALAR